MKNNWLVNFEPFASAHGINIEADDLSMTSEGDISFLERNEEIGETTVLCVIHRDIWREVYIVGPAGENCIEVDFGILPIQK